ncbi:unnamed protein product [Heligmosomoides polygyrus]|uniref:Peptidase A2 domain-containing protein n=1 Tax=Heligmosomoides polygyrus TaxID=6339 RepID=A0A183FH73_HELPZ|nr:unnamed protein product [Heligmosomoides polygyrus]
MRASIRWQPHKHGNITASPPPTRAASQMTARTATAQGESGNAEGALGAIKDCAEQRAARVQDKPTDPAKPERKPKIFTASLSRWRCGAAETDGLHEDLVGAQTTAQVQLLGMTRTALLDIGSQVSIIPLQMFVAAQLNGYDLDADVEEIELDRSKRIYDASGNATSFKGAVRLLNMRSKQRISLFVMAGGDDVIVLGTNALKKLGWSLPPNVQSSRGRVEVFSGRRRRRKEAKAKEAAVQQRRSKASKTVTLAEQLCLKPEETKYASLCCEDMKQDGVLRSSGEILPNTEGRKRRTSNPEKKTPAVVRVLRPRVAQMQRKKVIKKEPVGRSTLAKESTRLQLSKVDGDEVDYVKTAMGDVCAEFTSYLSALKRRLEGVICRHYVEVVGKHKATKSLEKKKGPEGMNVGCERQW